MPNGYHEDDSSKLAGELFSGKLRVEEALAKLRNRLLDLTMRNRLLNYRHPKGRSYQFTNDPDLDLLFERLLDGKPVQVVPVSDPPTTRYEGGKKPEARVYARELNIGTSIDIAPPTPNASRWLRPLQAVQYPADLERMMRKISAEARTVVEETGTNMLYLMFGFLEYFDSDESEKAVHAPLLSIPISLNRANVDPDSRTYLYDISYSGEDVAENFTLREKLRQQFRLELPEFLDEETPEEYFEKIQAAVVKRKNWTVKRRLSLGFLSFGKLAIWADLDPAKSDSLLKSELLRDIFEGGRAGASDAFHAEDYVIDAHRDGELPLIYDADSSQHSAIIDVKNGKSLVINGPPGTGKSQTITNIIASAIAEGKKVLFVSEKLAALEVVKQRLTSAGLGEFCLELHSHKTQKKQLLESIEQRMASKYVPPSGYSARIDILRERRKGLNAYAELLGSRIGNRLDLTVHEVFWATEVRRQGMQGYEEAVLGQTLPDAGGWSSERLERCKSVLGDAAAALEALGYLPHESPWLGFKPNLLVPGDEVAVAQLVRNALKSAQQLQMCTDGLEQIFAIQAFSLVGIRNAKKSVEELNSMPVGVNEDMLERLFSGRENILPKIASEAERLSQLLGQVTELQQRASRRLNSIAIDDGADFIARATSAGKHLRNESTAFSERSYRDFRDEVASLTGQLERISQVSAGREIGVPRDLLALREKLSIAVDWMSKAQLETTSAAELSRTGNEGLAAAKKVGDELSQVQALLNESGIPFAGKVEELEILLDGRGMPELLPSGSVDASTLDDLRRLAGGGWAEWTAEEFAQREREIAECVLAGKQALDELTEQFSRVGISATSSRSFLDGVEALLSVAEAAPKELLALRTPIMARQDFADIAIRAEEALKSVEWKEAKAVGRLHVDTLPSDEDLVRFVKVFRRGDSVFNIFNGEWRQAKAAFRSCVKKPGKYDASAMSEHFAAAIAWKTAESEFLSSEQFKSAFGAFFEGRRTDFGRIRRLHSWYQSSTALLMATEFSSVNLNVIPEQHLAQLGAAAPRLRAWVEALNQLPKVVASSTGLDPALRNARKLEELFPPLEEHVRWLKRGGAILRSLVVPSASVQRATTLVDLKRRLAQHTDLLVSLIAGPKVLCAVGRPLGLPDSAFSYQDLLKSLASLEQRSNAVLQVGSAIAADLGGGETLASALEVTHLLQAIYGAAKEFLLPVSVDASVTVAGLVNARREQVVGVMDLLDFLGPLSKQEFPTKELVSAAQYALDSQNFLETIGRDQSFSDTFGIYLNGIDTDQASIALCLEWARKVKVVSAGLPVGSSRALLSKGATTVASKSVPLILSASEALAAYGDEMAALDQWGQLDWLTWGGSPRASNAVAKLEGALASSSTLIAWSKFLAAQEDAQELGVSALLNLVVGGKLPGEFLVKGFEFTFYKSLTRAIVATHRELLRFTGSGHERLRADFAQMDKELISLNGAMYAAMVDKAKKPLPGISYGRAGDLTEMALLSKEVKKQKRHVPIRQLLKRAGRTLQELKPCFMMGPLSVAQYLEQGQLQFDLLVMDEASQLRPEDALGAISRAKQLVVVGDPKQLPPTNFFDRLMDGDDEDPEEAPAVVDGVESILGICEHLYRPVRTLRWHYRSRHESLIAFSNNQFYDGRLVVFPSPYKRSRRLGVNYRYVKEGVYQDRRNIPEAQRVVDAVMEHMLTCPEESLGVVTLNQTQRELIEDMLDKKTRDVKGVAEYLAHHENAGWKFFVKNLENVQGDERDVIFVSTTFGKPQGSTSVRQNFGPINRPDGWRRLNVLFTRARKRLDLFTSMLPTDVQADEKVSLGRRALREYLEYAKTGVLQNVKGTASEREADSDFEVAVADALRQHGYEVTPQVGVAGYFIDLGVCHPERKSEFIAGIECDGVTYHSSLSARDRDRIRQEVLESLGWHGRIIRVWSTDWFSDPIGQTQRLVEFLSERAQRDLESPIVPFDDDVEEALETEFYDERAVEDAESSVGESDPARETSIPELFADIGDRVTYETLDGVVERHTVQIVDSPSNLRLGLLNDETPLAEALLGLTAGEEGVLHVAGQTPRRLKVLEILRQPQTSLN